MRHMVWWLPFLLAAMAPGGAGANPLPPERMWQVIAIEGKELAGLAPVAGRDLFVYRQAAGGREPVPFQVDERDPQGRFSLPEGPEASQDESPGVLDANDLLVFAARDLGECGAAEDGAVEILARDPVTGQEGCVYVRLLPGAPRATRDDVHYDPVRDIVRTRWYTVGFGPHTPDRFSFVDREGREGPDLLDRVKARVTARLFWGLLRFRRNEDDLTSRVTAWKDGPVRLIRRARLYIRLGFGLPSPELVAEDFLTAETFEGPVAVHLPFDLSYVFGDLEVNIFLDFVRPWSWRVFAEGLDPLSEGCSDGTAVGPAPRTDWFGAVGSGGGFVHVLLVSPGLQGVERRLYLVSDPAPDPPEDAPGNCPGIGYRLTGWRGIGRGTHRMEMVIRAFRNLDPDSARRFLGTLRHPLEIHARRIGGPGRAVVQIRPSGLE